MEGSGVDDFAGLAAQHPELVEISGNKGVGEGALRFLNHVALTMTA